MFSGLPLPPSSGFSDIDDFGHDDQVAQLWDAYYDAYEGVVRARLLGDCVVGQSKFFDNGISEMAGFEQENRESRHCRCGIADRGPVGTRHRSFTRNNVDCSGHGGTLRSGCSVSCDKAELSRLSPAMGSRFLGDQGIASGCAIPLPFSPRGECLQIRNREWLARRAISRWLRYYEICTAVARVAISGGSRSQRVDSDYRPDVVSESGSQDGDASQVAKQFERSFGRSKDRLSVRFVPSVRDDGMENPAKPSLGSLQRIPGHAKHVAHAQPAGFVQQQSITSGGLGNSFLRRLSPDAVPVDEDQRRQRSKLKRAKKMNKQRSILPSVAKSAMGYSEGLAELAKVSSSGSQSPDGGTSCFRRTMYTPDPHVAEWVRSRVG